MTTQAAAFQATIHGFRTVPSRGVVSITIEAPIEHHAEIAKIAVHGAWVAVARLQEPKDQPAAPQPKDARRWADTSPAQQAGIRCEEPIFQAFLRQEYPDFWRENEDAADTVRSICGVQSRSDLTSDQKGRVLWHQLDTKFQAWKTAEQFA